jgi:asparagine N-glycosylation enzyme membrane subunit Stt3
MNFDLNLRTGVCCVGGVAILSTLGLAFVLEPNTATDVKSMVASGAAVASVQRAPRVEMVSMGKTIEVVPVREVANQGQWALSAPMEVEYSVVPENVPTAAYVAVANWVPLGTVDPHVPTIDLPCGQRGHMIVRGRYVLSVGKSVVHSDWSDYSVVYVPKSHRSCGMKPVR